MKKFMIVFCVISMLLLAGCDSNENIQNNSELMDSNNQIVVEENFVEDEMNTYFSNEQLIEKAKEYRKNRGEYMTQFVEVESESGDIVIIHLYDDMGTHIATSDWYYINRNTAIGEDLLGNMVDLNEQIKE